MTLATGCVLAIARELAMQGKPALNRCTARMSCRYVQMRNENERQPAWVASTSISLRCILHTYLYIYIHIFMYSFYFITLQRSGTRTVTKPLRSIRPEHRGTFHTQFWLTAKCASRHSDVQFFISHLARWLRTRRCRSLLFNPEPQIIRKTQCLATILPFRASASSFFDSSSSLIFSLVFSSLWLFPSLLFICPYCRKFRF